MPSSTKTALGMHDEEEPKLPASQAEMMRYAKTELIAMMLLKIDRRYQRPLSDTKVRAMVKEFNLGSAGVLLVSRRANGEMYIIDGQHRFKAMQIKGLMYAPCQVYEHLSEQEESEMFVKANTARAVPSAIDLHRAKVMAEDPIAIVLERVVNELGCTIQKGRGKRKTRKPNELECVSTLEEICRLDGESGLKMILRLVLATWPNNEQALRATVVGGTRIFLSKFKNEPQYDERRFVDRLSVLSILQLLQETRAISSVLGGHHTDNFARVIYREYNKRLTTNRLPDKFGIDEKE